MWWNKTGKLLQIFVKLNTKINIVYGTMIFSIMILMCVKTWTNTLLFMHKKLINWSKISKFFDLCNTILCFMSSLSISRSRTIVLQKQIRSATFASWSVKWLPIII